MSGYVRRYVRSLTMALVGSDLNVGCEMCLSPASAPKPGSVRKQVALGLAGESPGKRGRKFKVGAKLLEAASLRASLSQANEAEQGGREILKTLKAAMAGTKHDAASRGRSSTAGS